MAKNFLKLLFSAVAVFILSASAFMAGCLWEYKDSREWMLKTIEKNYYFYDDFDKEGLDGLSLKEIAARLDIYSEYYTAEEIEEVLKDNSGVKAGIGFSYSYVEGEGTPYPDGGALIVTVVGNSPAEASGMKPGVVLTGATLNGNTVEFTTRNAMTDFIDGVSENVEFSLNSSAGESFTVSKQVYEASYTYMATSDKAWAPVFTEKGKLKSVEMVQGREISYLPEGTAYVQMSQFYGTAASEFGLLMEKFNAEGCTSLILDLRNNGGGYVSVMQDMAGYFTSSIDNGTKLAMTATYRSGKKEVYNCTKHKGNGLISKDKTVYVLANSGTASASEALIGALVSYGFLKYENIFLSDYGENFINWAGGEYKTAQSYGKGIMQSTFTNYLTGEALKLTTAQIYWPNGKCIHGVGLTPEDGCRTVRADWIVTPNDEELQKAVEMIKGN